MATLASEPHDYSLVLGGPLFQLYRRGRLSGDGLELVHRRALAITLIAWLPLLLLSVLEGRGFGGGIRLPFLYDVEAHTRFLVALPALILAEVFVHRRVAPVMRWFVERGIVTPEDVPQCNTAVEKAVRVRNSVALEVTLVVLVYTVGLWVRSQLALSEATWYALPGATGPRLTLAGYWYAFVSVPFFQFILLRWYVRLVLWFWLLWRVSKLNLRLSAAHPDRAGGIAFLGKAAYAFQPVLFAQGALLSGVIASRILYDGQSLLVFKMEIAGLVGALILVVLGPLAMFTPHLDRAKRSGLATYGSLANSYVFAFEERWLRGAPPDRGDLLGTGDIQSLADLGNSMEVVRQMRVVPFGLDDIIGLAVATAAPLLPLTLTMFSLDALLTGVVKALL
jgi:hypothetical protein